MSDPTDLALGTNGRELRVPYSKGPVLRQPSMSPRTNGAALPTALSFEGEVAEKKKKREPKPKPKPKPKGRVSGEKAESKENKASERRKAVLKCQLSIGYEQICTAPQPAPSLVLSCLAI